MSASALPFLPQEILIEILTKLPSKSLLQFRCVSKFFYSLIADPLFADLHRNWSLTLPSRMSILISFPTKTWMFDRAMNRVYYTINYIEGNQVKLQANRVGYLERKRFQKFYFGSSVNGLLCLCSRSHREDVAICNFSTRQRISLPRTRVQSNSLISVSALLGFDPVSKRYKVLKSATRVDHKNRITLKHWVLTLGVDKSWREINCCAFCPYSYWEPYPSHTSVHIDGIIYSLNSLKDGKICGFDIAAFDVGAENFCMISFPNELRARYYSEDFLMKSALVEVDGRLSIIHVPKVGLSYNMEIWTLEKYMEWEKRTIPIPLEGSQASLLRFTTNHVGEITLLSIKNKSFSILFYNFKRQIWRKFEICGLDHFPICGAIWRAVMHIIVDNVFFLK